MSAPLDAGASAPSSTFVTATAWIFIGLSAFSTLGGALQIVMTTFLPFKQLDTALHDPAVASHIPPVARVMFAHFQAIAIASFLLSLTMLIASVGLLRRRNWARWLFVALLILVMSYTIAS